MSEDLIIETKELTKNYDGVPVVDKLDLQISRNEIFGLLGPNGAGKTTTILMLMGLTEPSSGTLRVCGFNPTREPLKVKRIVGYMPEKVGFYEGLTARENLRFVGALNKIRGADLESRIDELLKSVGLADVADKRVGTYSRGMKQRLGIADTLIKKPELVIFDEPTAGLDPEGINHIIRLIAGLPKLGTTVIMCSHHLPEVQKVCNSIGIIAKGKMITQGRLDELSHKASTEGRFRIEVETVNPDANLKKAILGIKGVRKIQTEGDILIINADNDIRAEISKAVVNSNFPLTQVKIQEFSLDEIYMRYFREET